MLSNMIAEIARYSFPKGMKRDALITSLLTSITQRTWPLGGRLPTERELAATHGVGINTVRRAIGELVASGIVERRQGSGTYVVGIPDPSPRTSRLVGLLVPSTAYFYPRVISGAERELSGRGVSVLIASSEYRPDLELERIRRLLDDGVQGLILVPNLHLVPDPQETIDRLQELPVPFVLAERRPPAPKPDDDTTFVVTDHGAGVYHALRHLAELGHHRIGFLGRFQTGTSDAVAAGFEAACRELGLERVADVVQRRRVWSPEDIDGYSRRLAQSGATAVLCHGDEDAAVLGVRARRMGIGIPDDLALIAYDDEVAHLGETPLTAIAPPKEEVGATAARLLIRRMNDPAYPSRRVELLPRLVIRDSCGGGTPSVQDGRLAEVPR